MQASPRSRRLRNDLAALERLRDDSSIFSFTSHGNPPHHYQIAFKGRGLWHHRGQVRPADIHRVDIRLGASYPRTMPEIRWITPIYHPNISEIGMVCLGGYGAHWVPSVQIDDLCTMLWDMARYHNYDIRSPYNRESALWAANQVAISFPTDSRPLRDVRVAKGRLLPDDGAQGTGGPAKSLKGRDPSSRGIAAKVHRFTRFYGMIFGSADESEVQADAGPSGARPARRTNSSSTPEPPPVRPSPDPEPTTGVVFQDVEVQAVSGRDQTREDEGDDGIFFIG